MTEFLFPDNTVLCDFAAVERVDLLRSVLNGRGRWTEAVTYEASRSARVLPALRALLGDDSLGEPIEIDDEHEILRINAIQRAVFGGDDDEPLKHLGEAQTCFLIRERPEFAGSWWISDDKESLCYARRQGITTRETVDLVGTAVAYGDLGAEEGFELMQRMADEGCGVRLPDSPADLRR